MQEITTSPRRKRAETKDLPSLEVLDATFDPDFLTGTLKWKRKRPGPSKPDLTAGCLNAAGYIFVGLAGTRLLAHRVIWKMFYREEPPAQIDHRNGTRSDNRPENLRAATQVENCANMKLSKRNTSGHKGVCWDRSNLCWRTTIRANGKKWAQNFHTLDEAVAAIKVAREALHMEFANHG